MKAARAPSPAEQRQDEGGRAERADVAAPHHLERPGPVPAAGGEAVDGVGEPVEVQATRRRDENGQRKARRHQLTGTGPRGERADGGRGHGERSPDDRGQRHAHCCGGAVHEPGRGDPQNGERAGGEARAVAERS